MNDEKAGYRLVRRQEIEEKAFSFSHPWNPESSLSGTHLSELGGLQRTGVSIARIPPGKDSLVYHSHYREEEWIYILSGRAIARVDDQEHELEAGDFVAFPTPSVAHNLSNPFDTEVVYLMGGEHRTFEIADFPDHGRRMVRMGNEMTVHRIDDEKDFFELGPEDE